MMIVARSANIAEQIVQEENTILSIWITSITAYVIEIVRKVGLTLVGIINTIKII